MGELVLGTFHEKLCICDWRYRKKRVAIDRRIQKALHTNYIEATNPLINETKKQLSEYFNGKRKVFNLPYILIGSDFQVKIWQLLEGVSYGKTQSYKALALAYGNKKAIRAVASANGANALSIIIPCHRVIGSNLELHGYAGGLRAKQKLLQIEGSLNANQLKLF